MPADKKNSGVSCVSVHEEGCQSAILVPVCRQLLLPGREVMQEPQKCHGFPPFSFSSHTTKPPHLSICCFFLGFPLSCLYSALLQLVSRSCSCFSYSGLVLYHLVHPGPTTYSVMTVQSLCATEKSLVMITPRLFCLLYLLKIFSDMWEGIEDSDSMVKKEPFFNPGIWYELFSQYKCANTTFFASVDKVWVPL